jgi:hypothetical protein
MRYLSFCLRGGQKLAIICVVLFLGALSSSSAAAASDDEILHQMWAKSDTVLHIKVIEVSGGEEEEIGAEDWAAKCEIITPFKQQGALKKTVNVRFQHFRKAPSGPIDPRAVRKPTPPELLKLAPGKEYVLFLAGEAGGVRLPSDTEIQIAHTLVDRWLGVQDANIFLRERLKVYGTEKSVTERKR